MNCPPCTQKGLHWRVKDIRGHRFGRLVVQSHAGIQGANRNHHWNCLCDCGCEVTVNGAHLRGGVTQSCGCLQRDIARAAGDRTRTHGMRGTSTYAIWSSMLARCDKPTRKDYHRYGGRGIAVCDRWRIFENFFADMGERPADLTLDRINNDGNYEPGNCRWATRSEQERNKTRKVPA